MDNKCELCGSERISLDDFYGLPKCYEFILLCPKHPGKVIFDLPDEQIEQIANQE